MRPTEEGSTVSGAAVRVRWTPLSLSASGCRTYLGIKGENVELWEALIIVAVGFVQMNKCVHEISNKINICFHSCMCITEIISHRQ